MFQKTGKGKIMDVGEVKPPHQKAAAGQTVLAEDEETGQQVVSTKKPQPAAGKSPQT